MNKLITAILTLVLLAVPLTTQAQTQEQIEEVLPEVATLLDEVQTSELLPDIATLLRETPTEEIVPEIGALLEGADINALTNLQQVINQQLVLHAAENWEWTLEKQIWLTLQVAASALVLGALLLRLIGRQAVEIATVAKQRVAWSFFAGLLGLISFLLVPLLLITQVGSFLALAFSGIWLLGLAAACALAGLMIGSIFIKLTATTRFTRRLLALTLGTGVLAALSFVPFIGLLLVSIALIATLGSLIVTRFSFYKSLKKSKLV